MKKISRFARTGKYQLLRYVAPNIWDTIKIFEDDSDALTYAKNKRIAITDDDEEKLKRIMADEAKRGNRQWE